MTPKQRIEYIKTTIVEHVKPEQIILFGSQVRGDAHPDSDIDIVVIWSTNLNPHQRKVRLARLFPGRKFGLDIFAYTPQELSSIKDIPGTILYEALQHGKVIYGKPEAEDHRIMA